MQSTQFTLQSRSHFSFSLAVTASRIACPLACVPKRALVNRLAYNGDVAAGQLAVFQGASEAPISESYGSSEQRGKTANWPRPGGLR
jgi:hypothetical protein